MLTPDEHRSLAWIACNNGVTVYSPTAWCQERYGPLEHAGLVTIKDIGDRQETIFHIEPTKAGLALLEKTP